MLIGKDVLGTPQGPRGAETVAASLQDIDLRSDQHSDRTGPMQPPSAPAAGGSRRYTLPSVGPMDPYLIYFLLGINLLAFAAMGIDKWRAIRRVPRTSERALLLCALPRGVLGAWPGMSTFRHKTRKTSFRWKMAGVTLMNAAAVALAWRYL